MNRQVVKQSAAVLAGAFWVLVLMATGALYFVRLDMPKIRSIADYAPLQSSQVFSDDGQLVGEFFNERRRVVPFNAIPMHVAHAFLAAEDANFYAHEGIDYFGILRAMLKNLRPGAHLQGASTITQQTVKTLVLGPERSLLRKVREAILARELEQLLTKDEILAIYLNQIYFGNGAYGVEQAAQTYFGKSVRQLTLGEGALLAASPKSPGRYNIKSDPAAAKNRQTYVLDQMLAHGWATPRDVQLAKATPVPYPADAPPYLGKAPYYMDVVKKQLTDKYGEQRLLEGGLVVYLGLNAKMQAAADTAIHQGLEDLSRRQGYAGAPLRIEVDRFERFRKALHDEFQNQLQRRHQYSYVPTPRRGFIWDLTNLSAAQLTDETNVRRGVDLAPLAEYQRVRAPVFKLDKIKHEAFVDLGSVTGRLPLANMSWARKFSPKAGSTPAPHDPGEALRVGDIITVEIAPAKKGAHATDVEVVLIPETRAEGALVAIEPQTRMVRALIGGSRNEAGGFNRAVQALRQPGSAFKPIVYASALSSNAITPASICPDSPVVIPDPWTGKVWKPENYEDGKYDGNITYRTALMRSKNTCSVRLLQKIGPEQVIGMARAMGISSRMPENLTIALGTGDTTPLELANAYATIADGGQYAPPIFVRKVVDSRGQVLEENRATLTQAMTPQVAYVLTSMMRSVVDKGTARRALMLERPLAGKTGTSQESRNVWFSGFSPGLVATVWEGFDNNDSMGYETGASAALPTWIRFMGAALAAEPPHDFAMPENIVTVNINPLTGLLADGPESVPEVFVAGSEPTTRTEALPSLFMEDDEAQKAP